MSNINEKIKPFKVSDFNKNQMSEIQKKLEKSNDYNNKIV